MGALLLVCLVFEQAFELSVKWDALTFMWDHTNDKQNINNTPCYSHEDYSVFQIVNYHHHIWLYIQNVSRCTLVEMKSSQHYGTALV